MALNVGELTAYLTVDNSRYKRGVRDARGDLNQLARDADRQATATAGRTDRLIADVTRSMSTVGRDADRSGREAGGLLARGVREGFVRQSPLIIAAVGGALAAGAPLMITSAGTLFAGIGIAAAAQTTVVRKAWSDTWENIRDDTITSSAPIQRVLIDVAEQVGGAFQYLRPQMAEAFAGIAPQIQTVVDGLLRMGMHAMPGLLDAVRNSGPVFDGLSSMLVSIGDGLSDFFTRLTQHSPAAGDAFAAIGDVVRNLLPTLAELLGQGAELAADVLPVLARSLGVVTDVADRLGPLLPPIVTALIGMKVAQTVGGWVGGLGTSMQTFATRTGVAEGAAGRFQSVTSRIAATLPVVGAAIVGVEYALTSQSRESEKAQQALANLYDQMRRGGAAGADAAAQLEGFRATMADLGEDHPLFDVMAEEMEKAERAAGQLWRSMTPLEQAQAKVAEWTATLSYRLNDESASAEDVSVAQQRLAHWTAESERQQSLLEDAVDGVTTAMINQADQAMASIDSHFANARAAIALEDAEQRLADIHKEGTATSEELQRAQLDVAEAAYRSAQAWGKYQADMSGADKQSAQYARTVQTETLAQLVRLRDAAGPEMKRALDIQIAALERSGVSLDETRGDARTLASEFDNLGRKRPTPVVGLQDLATSKIRSIAASIANLRDRTIFVTTYYQTRGNTTLGQASGRYVVAGGGPIGSAPWRGLSEGGRVDGPGSWTSDSVGPFLSRRGLVYLSDDEQVIKARSAVGYGRERMDAVNDGRAIILLPDELPRVRGFASGGRVGDTPATELNRVAMDRAAGALHVHFHGPVIADRQTLRRTARMFRDAIVDDERSYR